MMTTSSILAVLGINAIFGGAYLMGKLGVEHFPPFLFTAFRFALVVVALSPFLRIDAVVRRHWRAVLGFCFCMGIGVYSTMYWALFLADGASAVLIGTQFATPAAVLLGAWRLREKTTTIVWGGILITLSGVVVVGFDTVVLGYPLAFLLVIISAMFYAIANVISRGLSGSGLGLLNLNALMAVTALPPMLLLSWMTGEEWQTPIREADIVHWSTVLYSAWVVTLVGHVGLFRLLQIYPLSAIMPFYVFTPIFGVIGALIFLDEMLTARFAGGALLAIIGILIIDNFHRRNKKRAADIGVEV